MKLHDTRTGLLKTFTPPDGPITVYVCGPTVYDVPHIGNARPAIVFDALVRTLRYLYGEVLHVSNFTDVDDKIILRAEERSISIGELCETTIIDYNRAMHGLGVADPDVRPRATQSIPAMIVMVEELIARGFAYENEGHVYFDVEKGTPVFRISGDNDYARIEASTLKKNAADFVLWKPEWQGVGWDSPWGRGRPGWHLECSAMIREHIGATIDIHAGGQDLIFPHHEAECQQSHAANGAELARHWIHNGMVLIDGRKMSKSDNNFVTVDDVLERPQGGVALRMSMLMTHYRQPYDFTRERLKAAQVFYNKLMDRAQGMGEPDPEFVRALEQDFNTPLAMSRLANAPDSSIIPSLALLGFTVRETKPLNAFEIGVMEQREIARLEKNWATSDELRNLLNERGIVIEDQPNGDSTWKRNIEDIY